MKKMIANILVVDERPGRAEAIASAFDTHLKGIDVFFYDGESKQDISTKLPCNLPESISLLVLHNRNKKFLDYINLNQENILVPIIRYTGGPPPGEEEYPGETWVRKRSIDGAEDAPTGQEVKEVLDWGNHILEGNEDPPIPSLFIAPGVMNYLPALAILCQGYLAVHASNGGDENNSLKPALEQMGWFDLGDDREKIDESLSKNKEQVESANWWLAPFGLDGLEMDDSKWNEFEEKLRNEKEDVGEEGWDTVQKFINENIRKGDFEPETIANVYCSLVSMLEGRPCSM